MKNLLFSVPHRALAILLGRGLLVNYSLRDDGVTKVLNGNEYSICIKPEAANAPVFLAAQEGGRGLIDKPMQSHSLSEFMKRSCNDLSIVSSEGCMEVSFYAWRNNASNQIFKAKGIEVTRALMGHSPDSNTFMKYYWSGIEPVDVFGVAAGESENKEMAESSENRNMALHRAQKSSRDREEAFIRNYIDNDDEVKKCRRILSSSPSEDAEDSLFLHSFLANSHALFHLLLLPPDMCRGLACLFSSLYR